MTCEDADEDAAFVRACGKVSLSIDSDSRCVKSTSGVEFFAFINWGSGGGKASVFVRSDGKSTDSSDGGLATGWLSVPTVVPILCGKAEGSTSAFCTSADIACSCFACVAATVFALGTVGGCGVFRSDKR